MKVLITGATGFIGSHLAQSLVKDGHEVRCLYRKGEDTTFLDALKCEMVCGDLRDRDSLENAVKGVKSVYHLAALSRYDATADTDDYYKVNVAGTRHLLEFSRRYNIETFIYISSVEGRGLSQDGNPLTESSPSHPRNIYGKTK